MCEFFFCLTAYIEVFINCITSLLDPFKYLNFYVIYQFILHGLNYKTLIQSHGI